MTTARKDTSKYPVRSRDDVKAELRARKSNYRPLGQSDTGLKVNNPNTSARLYRAPSYDALAIRSASQAASALKREEAWVERTFSRSISNNNEVIYGKDQPAAFH